MAWAGRREGDESRAERVVMGGPCAPIEDRMAWSEVARDVQLAGAACSCGPEKYGEENSWELGPTGLDEQLICKDASGYPVKAAL